MCCLMDRRGRLQGWDSEDGWRDPNSPSSLFLWLQRHVVPHVPVLGTPHLSRLAVGVPQFREGRAKVRRGRVSIFGCVLTQAPTKNRS